LGKLANLV